MFFHYKTRSYCLGLLVPEIHLSHSSTSPQSDWWIRGRFKRRNSFRTGSMVNITSRAWLRHFTRAQCHVSFSETTKCYVFRSTSASALTTIFESEFTWHFVKVLWTKLCIICSLFFNFNIFTIAISQDFTYFVILVVCRRYKGGGKVTLANLHPC